MLRWCGSLRRWQVPEYQGDGPPPCGNLGWGQKLGRAWVGSCWGCGRSCNESLWGNEPWRLLPFPEGRKVRKRPGLWDLPSQPGGGAERSGGRAAF